MTEPTGTTDAIKSPLDQAISKTVMVPITPERAFSLFTDGMATWWPTARFSVAMYRDATVRNVVIEPGEGGAIYEIAEDGERAEWGHVTRWEPPHRLGMQWYPGVGMEEASTVVVSFHAERSGTRVVLTHTGLDRRPNGNEMIARYTSGWDTVLAPFVEGAKHEATASA